MSESQRKQPQAPDQAAAPKAGKERAAEQIEHDQDREPPRTAVPPPGWKPSNKPSGEKE